MRFFKTLLFLLPVIANSQQNGNYSAAEIARLQSVRIDSLSLVPELTFRYVKLAGRTDAAAWRNFWTTVEGEENRALLKFLNRDQLNIQKRGDSLVVPSILGTDLRAYSPFPRVYEAGKSIDKLFIIDKQYQVYAAYEFGKLVRWGVICTGAKRYAITPNGRFNFNWKQAQRVSSESPQGEQWHMRWVSNFYQERGIHTHQSPDVRMAGPASHGCVRMTENDAKWVYDWSVGWTQRRNQIVKQGSLVIVQGEHPEGKTPKFFRNVGNVPTLIQIVLPEDPLKVEAGAPQQRQFDKIDS